MNTRNTMQKEIVYNEFLKFKNHPSIDMIYDEIHKNYPTISKATVYRVINQFAKDGKIQQVKILDHADRYDFNLSSHMHIRCKNCGCVDDIFADNDLDVSKLSKKTDYKITNIEINLEGICKNCQKKEEEK